MKLKNDHRHHHDNPSQPYFMNYFIVIFHMRHMRRAKRAQILNPKFVMNYPVNWHTLCWEYHPVSIAIISVSIAQTKTTIFKNNISENRSGRKNPKANMNTITMYTNLSIECTARMSQPVSVFTLISDSRHSGTRSRGIVFVWFNDLKKKQSRCG